MNEERIEALPPGPRRIIETGLFNKRIMKQYVGGMGELNEHVTRIDLISNTEPFSQESLKKLRLIDAAILEAIPDSIKDSTEVYMLGATASIRDLKLITDRDQIKIDVLVIIVVYLIMVLLLRTPVTCLYLIMSVFFSYLVTMGVTFAFFWSLDPAGFQGIDWKVRMFLFVILIAIGEDYNIFLMTRYLEEKKQHGAINGIKRANSSKRGVSFPVAG